MRGISKLTSSAASGPPASINLLANTEHYDFRRSSTDIVSDLAEWWTSSGIGSFKTLPRNYVTFTIADTGPDAGVGTEYVDDDSSSRFRVIAVKESGDGATSLMTEWIGGATLPTTGGADSLSKEGNGSGDAAIAYTAVNDPTGLANSSAQGTKTHWWVFDGPSQNDAIERVIRLADEAFVFPGDEIAASCSVWSAGSGGEITLSLVSKDSGGAETAIASSLASNENVAPKKLTVVGTIPNDSVEVIFRVSTTGATPSNAAFFDMACNLGNTAIDYRPRRITRRHIGGPGEFPQVLNSISGDNTDNLLDLSSWLNPLAFAVEIELVINEDGDAGSILGVTPAYASSPSHISADNDLIAICQGLGNLSHKGLVTLDDAGQIRWSVAEVDVDADVLARAWMKTQLVYEGAS